MPPMPPITQALLLINVAVFCIDLFLNGLLSGFGALHSLGWGFMPWQVVTYAFLHGSVGHLFFNMLGLWMFGSELERLWGQPRFIRFYAASVLSAAAMQIVVNALLGSRGGNWEILTAGAFITIVVPLIVFFSLQRYFVRGLLAGSVK